MRRSYAQAVVPQRVTWPWMSFVEPITLLVPYAIEERLLQVICRRINAMRRDAGEPIRCCHVLDETSSCQFLQSSCGHAGWNEFRARRRFMRIESHKIDGFTESAVDPGLVRTTDCSDMASTPRRYVEYCWPTVRRPES